jgi:integrating conjugative element protein (TIGR03765 family)
MREQFSWSTLVHVAISLLDRSAVATRGQAHARPVLSVQLVSSSRGWETSFIAMLLGGLITIFYAANLHAQPLTVIREGKAGADGAHSAPGVTGVTGIPIGLYLAQTLSANDEPGTSPMVSFPISSARLSAGKMLAPATWQESQWISSAFFVIGDDPQSLAWLKANQQVLRLKGASGLVVNVNGEEAFKRIEREANGIVLMPWTSEWLEESLVQLNGGFYPVLVGTDGQLRQDIKHVAGGSGE